MTGSFGPGNLGQPDGGFWGCGSGPCFSGLTWLATLRGRVGPTFGPFLPYITGGLAVGGIKAGIENNASFDVNGHALGWTLGAGIEVALHSGWSVKAEYLHVDLGFTQPNANDVSGDQKADIVRFGLNYRFGGHQSQSPISVGY